MTALQPIKIDLHAENKFLSGLKAEDILIRAADHLFPGRLCVVSSFGAEAVVLLHLISQSRPEIPVIFLNTGKLFPETLRYRDRLQAQLNLMDVRSIGPSPADLSRDDADATLWTRNTDQCCAIRP
jgi:phosphoadenosine phosphosulfate reductase